MGAVPFTPIWTAAPGSLISGLVPMVANGNFGEYTGANANNLTKPGIPLTIYAYSSPQATNLEVCGNDGTAGSLLVYTLPISTYGYNLTSITVYGGWQDAGRDAQDYTVYYSTVANPSNFMILTSVNYIPLNPSGTGDATRVVINDAAGGMIANNAAALKFDFTTPDGGSRENHAAGYTAITVTGVAATNLIAPPIISTASNQNSGSSFTPTWKIETNSLIAGQIPSVGSGSFATEAGVTGVSALTDGTFGAPSTFIPLTSVYYNPVVTGVSANRVAITTSTGKPLATNVAFIKFDFTPQDGNTDHGYSGYAEIIVQGTNGPALQPIWGSSPAAEPYPYVSTGSFSGPAWSLTALTWPIPTRCK